MPTHPPAIGPYRITGLLGQGGHAEVLGALHGQTHQPVAIKRLRQGEHRPIRYRGALEAEGRLIARLQHPHLPRIHNLAHYGGEPQLIMHYIPGEELGRILARAQRVGIPAPYATEIILQILDALSALHTLGPGYVHQDLKPSNILLSERGKVTVIDLGIAAPVDRPLQRIRQGTPGYRSPEQVLGAPQLTRASDLFSVAILWVELCTGYRLFPPSTCQDLAKISKIHQNLPRYLAKRLHGIPPELRQLVQRLLQFNAQDRPQRAALVAAQIRVWQKRHPMGRSFEIWARRVVPAHPVGQVLEWEGATVDGQSGGQGLTL